MGFSLPAEASWVLPARSRCSRLCWSQTSKSQWILPGTSCPWQERWNETIFVVPPNPNRFRTPGVPSLLHSRPDPAQVLGKAVESATSPSLNPSLKPAGADAGARLTQGRTGRILRPRCQRVSPAPGDSRGSPMSPQPPPGPGGSLGFPVALQPGVTSGKGSSLKFNLVLPGGAWGYHPGAVPTLGQGNEACPDQTASSLFGKEQESGAGAAGPPRSHNPEIAGANHPALWRLGFFPCLFLRCHPTAASGVQGILLQPLGR